MNSTKIVISAMVALVVASSAFGAAEGDLIEADKNAMTLYRNGDKEGAIRLWSGCVPYLELYDPSIKGADIVSLHLAKAYYDKLKDDRGNEELLKKIVWYLSKAGLYGDAEVRDNVNSLITVINEGEDGDIYKKTLLGLVSDDVKREVAARENLRSEKMKLEQKKHEMDKKIAEAEKGRADAEKHQTEAEEELKKCREILAKEKHNTDEAKREAGEAKKAIEAAERTQKGLERQVQDLKVAGGRPNSTLNEQMKKFNEEKNRLEEENKVLSQRLARANSEVEAMEKDRSRAESRLADARVRIERLEKTSNPNGDGEYYMPIPAGFWRGLGCVSFSPFNYFRSFPQTASLMAKDEGLVIAFPAILVWDTVYVATDVAMGVLDIVSLGWFGNRMYKDNLTPWFWERSNDFHKSSGSTFEKD